MSDSGGSDVQGQASPTNWFIYDPNKGAPAFFAVAFFASGIFHIWQILRYKCAKLTFLFPICALLFAAGFAIREYGAFNPFVLGTYIASVFLIYISPPLLELANYHVLGRILYYVPYCAPLHPGRVFTTFAILSTVVEILNALGVAYSISPKLPKKTLNLGHGLLKAALLLQLIVAVLLCALAAVFHHRVRKRGICNRNVTIPLVTIYFSTALITARTIYRTVEYFDLAAGEISTVLKYEWYFYVFEGIPMLLDVILFNVLHPRRYLPEGHKIYLAQDGTTEKEGPGWMDDRPFIVTLCDPFDFIGLLTPSKSKKKFWEDDGVGEGVVADTQGIKASSAV